MLFQATLISSCVKIMLFSRVTICFRQKAHLYKCDYYMALKSIKRTLNLKFFLQRKLNKNKSACKRVDAGFDKYPVKNPFSLTSKSAN